MADHAPALSDLDARPRGHARLMPYVLLMVLVLSVNLVIFAAGVVAGWWVPHARSLEVIAAISQVNLLFAILPRQHWLVNSVSWLATRPSTNWPLGIRWRLAQYYHLGGAHVGGALAGTLWYVVYIALLAPAWADGEPGIDDVSLTLAILVVVTLLTICVLAMPQVRTRHHDLFEASHRFGSWLVLLLAWINTFLLAALQVDQRPFGEALVTSPVFWMLALSTALAIWPWLLLRKVPITVERPSEHAAIVRHVHGSTPQVGTTRAISRHALLGWHPFACVPPAAGEQGYRMVVSRAGGWTARFIDDPPDQVWVRGIPTVGVANAKRLFRRVLYVTTGSGIGPALGHLLTDTQGSRLVWVTRNPRTTYGEGLVDEVIAAQPQAVIWNTDEQGKPDVLALTYEAYVDSGADAVICISNRRVTARVVGELERRGIPAFGPIWDS